MGHDLKEFLDEAEVISRELGVHLTMTCRILGPLPFC